MNLGVHRRGGVRLRGSTVIAGDVEIDGNLTIGGDASLAGTATGFADPFVNQVGSFLSPPFATYGISANVLFPSATGIAYATYLGASPQAINTATINLELTAEPTAVVGWAEVGIARGTPAAGGGMSLTVLGYTSVAAWVGGGIGAKAVAVDISAYPVAAGDELFAVVSIESTTSSGGIRAYGPAGITGGMGAWESVGVQRLSTIVGAPTVWGTTASQQLLCTLEKDS